MSDKRRWPHAEARAGADELVALLAPACERIIIAGSLRRGKPDVGDVEILYIPRMVQVAINLYDSLPVSVVDRVLDDLLERGTLAQRLSSAGHPAWGAKNKLAVHVATGIPVDLFSTDGASWWNYLVCRTGPAESNVRICQEAQNLGYKWTPYGTGFTRVYDGMPFPMHSERAVFEFVGLPVPEWVQP